MPKQSLMKRMDEKLRTLGDIIYLSGPISADNVRKLYFNIFNIPYDGISDDRALGYRRIKK